MKPSLVGEKLCTSDSKMIRKGNTIILKYQFKNGNKSIKKSRETSVKNKQAAGENR